MVNYILAVSWTCCFIKKKQNFQLTLVFWFLFWSFPTCFVSQSNMTCLTQFNSFTTNGHIKTVLNFWLLCCEKFRSPAHMCTNTSLHLVEPLLLVGVERALTQEHVSYMSEIRNWHFTYMCNSMWHHSARSFKFYHINCDAEYDWCLRNICYKTQSGLFIQWTVSFGHKIKTISTNLTNSAVRITVHTGHAVLNMKHFMCVLCVRPNVSKIMKFHSAAANSLWRKSALSVLPLSNHHCARGSSEHFLLHRFALG